MIKTYEFGGCCGIDIVAHFEEDAYVVYAAAEYCDDNEINYTYDYDAYDALTAKQQGIVRQKVVENMQEAIRDAAESSGQLAATIPSQKLAIEALQGVGYVPMGTLYNRNSGNTITLWGKGFQPVAKPRLRAKRAAGGRK
jgi:hypothetical protein